MSLMDDILRDAMQRGEFDNLPGQGQPLKLDDDPTVPDDLKLAHKIMRDNNIVPDWVAEGAALEAALASFQADLRQALRTSGGALRPRTRAEFAERLAHYNRRVLSYNLKVPPGVTHRMSLDLDNELRRASL